jgi:NAD(P)-dependent dehydrogenase (short-subunit alcohol dehydrogenase family)
MTELRDRVVLITGAGKGGGRTVAQAFGARGACVAANDISPVNVDEVVAGIRSQGGRAAAYIHDVAKKAAVHALVREVEDDWGRIEVMIQHAAVEPRVPLLEMDEWDWHRVLDVNLTGAFLMLQEVGRSMRAQGGGVIMQLVPPAGPGAGGGRGAYLASLSGLQALVDQAAAELAPHGVRVHAVGTGADRWVETVIDLCKG